MDKKTASASDAKTAAPAAKANTKETPPKTEATPAKAVTPTAKPAEVKPATSAPGKPMPVFKKPEAKADDTKKEDIKKEEKPATPAAGSTPPADAKTATPTDPKASTATPPAADAAKDAKPDDGAAPATPADASKDPAKPGAAADPTKPADPNAKPADPNAKPPMTRKKKIIIGSAIGIVLGVILIVALNFFFRKPDQPSGQQEASSSAQIATPEPTPEGNIITKLIPKCLPGFNAYENDFFGVCYPTRLSPTEEFAKGTTEVIKVVFSDGGETLVVQRNFLGPLESSNCTTNKLVKISGIEANRTIVKEEYSTGGCGNANRSYATLVAADENSLPYYLGLSKRSGTYHPQSLEYNIIEQSFRMKIPQPASSTTEVTTEPPKPSVAPTATPNASASATPAASP
jgi:hypothetical protein